MAVALDSTKALYSKDSKDSKNNKDAKNNNAVNANFNFINNNSYADSPSRNVRRSTRVASLSPSSFTPLISDSLPVVSGSSSATSATSSYMPASPSRKYSLMRSGYQGVSIDEIMINDIEPENRDKSMNLRSNPDRRHPTLDFHPTNLNTPSTTNPTLSSISSGITPSVKQINLQETPSQRILEKLVSKGDLEEIAKATPLGNKGTGLLGATATVTDKTDYKTDNNVSYNLSRIQVMQNSTNSLNNSNSNSNINSNSNNNSMPVSKTPQKQQTSNSNTTNNDSDETVKVVRTLRNRSIISSPIPTRRHSLSLKPDTTNNVNLKPAAISVLFKKHQKNLLAYSLVTLFILATVYHIYDGLQSTSEVRSNPADFIDPIDFPIEPPAQDLKLEDEIAKIISKVSQEQIIPNFDQKLQQVEDRLLEKLVDRRLEEEPVTSSPNKELLEKISLSVDRLEKKFKDFENRIEKKVKTLESENEKKMRELSELRDRELVFNREQEHAIKMEQELMMKKEQQRQSQSQSKSQSQSQSRSQSQSKSHSQYTINSVPVKVVKHLSTSPLTSGFFKSSEYPAENALIDNPQSPFKFKGNRGKLAVMLPANLDKKPTHVVIQQPLVPDRSCAPRDIEIWGLNNPLNERDTPVLLSKGRFDLSSATGEQSFPLLRGSFKVLQLRIRNNHGNDQFTCLYRFKVIQQQEE